MRKAYIIGILLLAVLLILGACAPASESPPAEPETTQDEELGELKYDDGTSDGSCAIGGPGKGHVLHFSLPPPTTELTIKGVKIYGHLGGTGHEDRMFKVEIWSEDFDVLYTCEESYDKFNLQPGWVLIDTPDIVVDGDFYIFVCTDSPEEGGVCIHYDSSRVNEDSEVTLNNEITEWYLQTPKEEVTWMIRVIGTTATSPSAAPDLLFGELAREIHENAWTKVVSTAQVDDYYKYALYTSRTLAVKHPEIYLQGDEIFIKAITTNPGFKQAYETKDVHSEYLSGREPEGAPFSFDDVEFSKYSLTPAREIYPDYYPFLPFLDRRLAPVATSLKTFDNRITQLEKAVQFYFKEKLAGSDSLYLIYCDNENAYLYQDGSLISMNNGEVESIEGNPILIFNEEWVWYPLMDRDDTAQSETLQELVSKYSTEIDEPVLSDFERDLIDELKILTEVETEKGMAFLSLVSIHSNSKTREFLPEELKQQFKEMGLPFIPTRAMNEKMNLISPISAYLAAIAKQIEGKEAIKALCDEYLKYAATPDQAWWAHGHAWFCGMIECGIEYSYRTHGGHCSVQAANIAAVLELADVDRYRMAGFTFWEEGWGGHDFIYVPGQDMIVSNGKIEDLQDTVIDYANDSDRESPFKYLHFIEHMGEWAWIGAHYQGTLSPNEVLEILTYLRGIHGDDVQSGKIVNNELIPIPFGELSQILEDEQKKWKPYELPSLTTLP